MHPKNLSAFEQSMLDKVSAGERIADEEALQLYRSDNLPFLALLAQQVRERRHQNKTFFNRNFHIEPTNICIYSCSFCSFARKPGHEPGNGVGWEYSLEDIEQLVHNYDGKPITEVHIVGGVHPKRDVHYYGEMIQRVKAIRPELHVKAFTAVELKVMCARAKVSIEEGLRILQDYGLDSIPGGGAEIFHPDVRKQICDTKASTDNWLTTHETAHNLGIASNCTMLYGHIEQYEHRVDHMRRLRELQDRTNGFNTFIPLKFLAEGNAMAHLLEGSVVEDLKNYAVARVYMDNIPHLKAYWPMIGKHTAQISQDYGVDDLDGTIDDSTKIYSMAGAEDQNPSCSTLELIQLIDKAGYTPVERDSLYRELRNYQEQPYDPDQEANVLASVN
jgi:aminodeoxyfutalosine synthase